MHNKRHQNGNFCLSAASLQCSSDALTPAATITSNSSSRSMPNSFNANTSLKLATVVHSHRRHQARFIHKTTLPHLAYFHLALLFGALLGLLTTSASAQSTVPLSVDVYFPRLIDTSLKISYQSTLVDAFTVVNRWPCPTAQGCPALTLHQTSTSPADFGVRMCNPDYESCDYPLDVNGKALLAPYEIELQFARQPLDTVNLTRTALVPTVRSILDVVWEVIAGFGYTHVGLITAPDCQPNSTPMLLDILQTVRSNKVGLLQNPGFDCASLNQSQIHVYLFAVHSLPHAALVLQELYDANLLKTGTLFVMSPYINDFDMNELEFYMAGRPEIMNAFRKVVVVVDQAQGRHRIKQRIDAIRQRAGLGPAFTTLAAFNSLAPEYSSRVASLWDSAVFLATSLRFTVDNFGEPCLLSCPSPPCIDACLHFAPRHQFAFGASQAFSISTNSRSAIMSKFLLRPTLETTYPIVGKISPETEGGTIAWYNPATTEEVAQPHLMLFSESAVRMPPPAGTVTIHVGIIYGRSTLPTSTLAAAYEAVLRGAEEYYQQMYPDVSLDLVIRSSPPTDCYETAQQLIDEGASVLIGGIVSDCSVNVATAAAERGVVHFTVGTTSLLDQTNRYPDTFRLVGESQNYPTAMVRLLEVINVSCVSVICDSSGLAHKNDFEVFQEKAVAAGLQLLTFEDISETEDRDATYWDSVLSNILAEGASTILLFLFPSDANTVLLEAAKHDMNTDAFLWFGSGAATATDVFSPSVKVDFDGRFIGLRQQLPIDFLNNPFLQFKSHAGHQSYLESMLTRSPVTTIADFVHVIAWAATQARYTHRFEESVAVTRAAILASVRRLNGSLSLRGFSMTRIWFNDKQAVSATVEVTIMRDGLLNRLMLNGEGAFEVRARAPSIFGLACHAPPEVQVSPTPSASSTSTGAIIAAAVLSGLLVVSGIGIAGYCYKYRPLRRSKPYDFEPLMQKEGHEGESPVEIPRSLLVIEDRLSEGAFGMVYQGYLKQAPPGLQAEGTNSLLAANRQPLPVVIKQNKFLSNPTDTDLLMSEALICQLLLGCSYIVQIIGVVTSHDRSAIVFEYCHYGALDDFLKSKCLAGQPMSWRVKARMLSHIGLGLHAIHERQIIHCDLACRNILVSNNLVCKIGDFGLARRGLVSAARELVASKIPIRWTAPEVFQYGVFSALSDVWSFGVVMWEVAANATVVPYHEFGLPQEVINAVRKDTKLYYHSAWPNLLKEILEVCWLPVDERPSMTKLIPELFAFRRWARREDLTSSTDSIAALTSSVAATGFTRHRNQTTDGGIPKSRSEGSVHARQAEQDQELPSDSAGSSHVNARGEYCNYQSSDEEEAEEALEYVQKHAISVDLSAFGAAFETPSGQNSPSQNDIFSDGYDINQTNAPPMIPSHQHYLHLNSETKQPGHYDLSAFPSPGYVVKTSDYCPLATPNVTSPLPRTRETPNSTHSVGSLPGDMSRIDLHSHFDFPVLAEEPQQLDLSQHSPLAGQAQQVTQSYLPLSRRSSQYTPLSLQPRPSPRPDQQPNQVSLHEHLIQAEENPIVLQPVERRRSSLSQMNAGIAEERGNSPVGRRQRLPSTRTVFEV
eukprot:m.205920 g.205920  ORF g.205920 m.205920 type:complete len:1594 (+) comp16900_c2_seq3:384-5165(+)